MVNRAERALQPAIVTLPVFDLGDRTGTEVSDAFRAVVTNIVVGTTALVVATNSTESVWLGSTRDGSALSRLEEQVRVVRRILSLNETVELAVLRSFPEKNGIPESGRFCGEVLSSGVELVRSV